MASPARTSFTQHMNDNDSEYGSDFSPEETQIVERLLRNEPAVDDNPIMNEIEYHGPQPTLRLSGLPDSRQRPPLFQAARAAERTAEQKSQSLTIGEQHPATSIQISESTAEIREELLPESTTTDPKNLDTRSPLERFRTKPKKAFSVTDLVSPAWCEMQYWYTLTLHGRKKRTPAMRQGSIVHQKLEEQVYTTIKVDVKTKEDAWGLRIWNVIQGLRTLRDTGLTRELEIWGTIDGLIVNGVIDELSYVCPDADLEESLQKPSIEKELPADQAQISQFFKTTGQSSSSVAKRSKRRFRTSNVYLCDVKTRSVKNLPSESAFRPTKMQLMLYHTLLAALATNTVEFSVLAARYDLDSSKVFSDAFIAQVGGLNNEIPYDDSSVQTSSQETVPNESQDSMTTLLDNNTLAALWAFMITEFQLTLPEGESSLGKTLKAEYRARDTGEVVGNKTFAMDSTVLNDYVSHEMKWWKGERAPQGVAIEDAFKCRTCEFADSCEWRLNKVEEAKEKVRMTGRRTASV